jgi:hypothetical protein
VQHSQKRIESSRHEFSHRWVACGLHRPWRLVRRPRGSIRFGRGERCARLTAAGRASSAFASLDVEDYLFLSSPSSLRIFATRFPMHPLYSQAARTTIVGCAGAAERRLITRARYERVGGVAGDGRDSCPERSTSVVSMASDGWAVAEGVATCRDPVS